MADLLLETPHPDEQRSYAALRHEFRSIHQEWLHSQLRTHPVGWGVLGDYRRARDRYNAEEWSMEMLHHLDAPVTQDFGLAAVPTSLYVQLGDLAEKALLHDGVTWDDSVEGVTDHDAPPCPPLTLMSDDEIIAYVDAAIEASGDEENPA